MSHERAMWLAVAQRAIEDIAEYPLDSVIYAEAAAFFLDRTGPWARSRRHLADLADVSPDAIAAVGLAAINRRRAGSGLVALIGSAEMIALVPSPLVIPPPDGAPATPAKRRYRRADNPFMPSKARPF